MARPALRDGWYYLRERVPQDILSSFEKTRSGKPRTEVWVALNTRTKSEANRLLPIAQVAIRERFDAVRRRQTCTAVEPVSKTPQQACAAFYALLQEQERTHRTRLVDYAKAHPDQFWRGDLIPIPVVDERGRDGFHGILGRALAQEIQSRLNDARGALAVMDMHYIRKATGETDEGLLPLLARTEVAFLEAVLRDPAALFGAMPPLGTISLASPVQLTSTAGEVPIFSTAVARFRPLKIREGWKEDGRMIQLLDPAAALLIDICGDKLITAYSKADVADFCEVLSRLPPHRTKMAKTKNLSAREAAALGLPPLNLKTVNDYVARIADVFNWAKKTFDAVKEHPFENAGFAIKSDQRNEKHAFSANDLKAIFARVRRTDDAKFWAPIVALYTGCRSNEILKLKKADVRCEDGTGIWHFDINEDEHDEVFDIGGRSVRVHHTLKRPSHRRRVPVHPDLVGFGFLEFVKCCKTERLFSEREPDKFGKFSDAFGKWFNRYLKEVGVKRAKIDFHSFRHSFVDACDGRMPDDIIRRLKGDARGGTLDRYGQAKTEIQILDQHLRNMKVPVDLSHLRL